MYEMAVKQPVLKQYLKPRISLTYSELKARFDELEGRPKNQVKMTGGEESVPMIELTYVKPDIMMWYKLTFNYEEVSKFYWGNLH